MDKIFFTPIGIIHTPFDTIENVPIQPAAAMGIKSTVEVFPEYSGGLKDLDGFSHIILLYFFHLSQGYKLEVMPFLDDKLHGIFATRAPLRPNRIGLSVVKLLGVSNNILQIENADIVNNTPLLDIKPYIPDFDFVEDIRLGWLEKSRNKISKKKSDDRFII